MPGTDRDLVRPLQKRIEKRYARILLKTRVAKLEAQPGRIARHLRGPGCAGARRSSTGCWSPSGAAPTATPSTPRPPASRSIGAASLPSTSRCAPIVPHIFAIGDIAGPPMLAHKATHEAKVAAEVAAGHKAAFDARCIPSVAYTDPEIAWVGVTETEAKARGIEFGKGIFPWAASGRSLVDQSRRGLHQDPVRQADASRHRRRHRRHQRGRIDRGGGARDRDGGRCGGYRLDHPCRIRRCPRRWRSPPRRSRGR